MAVSRTRSPSRADRRGASMWPVLLRVPLLDAEVPSYGVALALGIVFGLAVWMVLAARDALAHNAAYRIGVFTVAAAVAGAVALVIVIAGPPSARLLSV